MRTWRDIEHALKADSNMINNLNLQSLMESKLKRKELNEHYLATDVRQLVRDGTITLASA
jgi:hypothetical protein